MQPSDKAWIALAAGVASYELLAADGQLLSEAADRYIVAHPWTTRAIVAAVGIHLCNAIPKRWDPVHWLVKTKHILR